MTIFQDKLLTRTDCEEAGDYVVPNVLSPRDLHKLYHHHYLYLKPSRKIQYRLILFSVAIGENVNALKMKYFPGIIIHI